MPTANANPEIAALDALSDAAPTASDQEKLVIAQLIEKLCLSDLVTVEYLEERCRAQGKAAIERVKQKLTAMIGKSSDELAALAAEATNEVDHEFRVFINSIKPLTDAADLNTRLALLQGHVHAWAARNFGNNDAKQPGSAITLEHIGPLMGVVEEVAEYAEAPENDALAYADAIADALIYLLDYAARTGVQIEFTQDEYRDIIADNLIQRLGLNFEAELNPVQEILIAVGNLVRANLKWVQGIRGYHAGSGKFEQENKVLTTAVFVSLCKACTFTALPIAEFVFARVVQRDWVKNPERAGEAIQKA